MKRHAFLILGAGPTGLGAARRLEELGVRDWQLLESAPMPGGLASSFVDAHGFTWDIGGHVQFSHYEYFDRAMDDLLGQDGWLQHRRESWVWIRDRFVPYPLQNNLHHLPPADVSRCLQGLEQAVRAPQTPPSNFGAWIDATFGVGLAELFMRPYNYKVWAFPPEWMNTVWCGERVAVTDLVRVRASLASGQDDRTWGANHTFRFPLRGGTGAIWRACARCLPQEKIRLGARVVRIDLERREVITAAGEALSYDRLISTIPLRELIQLTSQTQFASVAERGLLYSSSNIFGLGLRGQPCAELAKKSWMYFPEANCPFYRVTVFSNYSPHNVPDSRANWSLMAEVSESPHKPVDQGTLLEEVITGACRTRLIERREDIVSTWRYRAEYGYPTPGLHRDEALEEIIPFFETAGVFSRGRFGLWKYEVSNQDHSFMQGVELVERLVNGRPEITAMDANLANSVKHPWPFLQWS